MLRLSKLPSALMVGAGLILPALASRAARTVAGKGYERIARRPPPRNPADPSVAWKEALVWSLTAGMLGGVARLAARRLLSQTSVPSEGDDLEKEADRLA